MKLQVQLAKFYLPVVFVLVHVQLNAYVERMVTAIPFGNYRKRISANNFESHFCRTGIVVYLTALPPTGAAIAGTAAMTIGGGAGSSLSSALSAKSTTIGASSESSDSSSRTRARKRLFSSIKCSYFSI